MVDPNKILLLPMCGLGDAVCYLPSIHGLRSKFPRAHIAVVVVSEAARTILEDAGCNVEVIVFNRGGQQRGWRPLLKLASRIRRAKYDVVLSGAHPNSVRVPLFAALSGAKLRVGAKAERYSFLYNRTIDVSTEAHVYERFRRLLTEVGLEMPENAYIPQLHPPQYARQKALALWSEAGLNGAPCVIGIASGADSNARGAWKPYLKRWRPERYADLIKWLSQTAGARVVTFGGMDETPWAEHIAAASAVPIVSFCGRTGVGELSWLLSWCTALVSNDTGIMHIGAAVGTPVIALFGPTSPLGFAPTGEQHRILQGKISCSPCYPHPICDLQDCGAMDAISLQQVKRSVAQVLKMPECTVGEREESASLIQVRNAVAGTQPRSLAERQSTTIDIAHSGVTKRRIMTDHLTKPIQEPKRIRYLGLSLECISYHDMFNRFDEWISQRNSRGHGVAAVNVNCCVSGLLNPELRKLYQQADLLGIDSMPFLYVARAFKNKRSDRLYAPDMMLETAKVAHQRGYKFFLYGGSPGAPETMTERLKRDAPDLDVVGTLSPPFRTLTPEEDDKVCRQILDSGANIVWVGLGSPKQDVWIAKHLEKLPGCILIASGATFDFFSGRIQQAPRWIRRTGFEWLFRLTQDPGRLWKRYTLYNVLFLGALALEVIGLLRLDGGSKDQRPEKPRPTAA